MKHRVFSTVAVVVFLLTSSCSCYCQGGGVVVRIPDGVVPRCVDGTHDRVWLTLYRVITNKSKGWFTQDNAVEILITAQVKTDPQAAKPLTFPLATEARIKEYTTGQVSVPVEYTIVSGLNLTQDNVSYTGLGVDVTLLNQRGRNRLGAALEALTEITGSNKLPIPPSPFTQAATYLLDFANTAISKGIQQQNSEDKWKSASLALNFDPDGTCTGPGPGAGGFETTGTKAIVMQDGIPGGGYVDIGHTNEYCWSSEITPVFLVKVARKQPNVDCADPSYTSQYKELTNNYVAFYLQKRQMSGHLGLSATSDRDRNESIKRCEALGIGASQCPGAEL
jgi:hypothetical protein